MKLVFKQKIFSWFDSYNIYDENNNIYFIVKGHLSWGHLFKIYNSYNEEIGMLKQKVLTFLPKYEIYKDGEKLGEIQKEFTFFKPKFHITFENYIVEGNFLEWDYNVKKDNKIIATISKELFHLTDTYIINVEEDEALIVLMIVLSIDSIKDRRSRNNN